MKISSVQLLSHVNSLQPYGLQLTRLPCPSPTPRACSNLFPLSRWCHPTISSSVILLSSCLQSFPASGSFPVSQFCPSGAKVLEFQLQHQSFQWIFRTDFFYDGLVGSPCSPRGSQESSPTPQFKNINSKKKKKKNPKTSILQFSAFFIVQLSHPNTTTGKTIALTR